MFECMWWWDRCPCRLSSHRLSSCGGRTASSKRLSPCGCHHCCLVDGLEVKLKNGHSDGEFGGRPSGSPYCYTVLLYNNSSTVKKGQALSPGIKFFYRGEFYTLEHKNSPLCIRKLSSNYLHKNQVDIWDDF